MPSAVTESWFPDAGMSVLLAAIVLGVILALPHIARSSAGLIAWTIRWKEAYNLHLSVSTSRSRNITALAITPVIILLFARFGVIPFPEDGLWIFSSSAGPWEQIGAAGISLASWIALRWLCVWIFKRRNISWKDFIGPVNFFNSFVALYGIIGVISFWSAVLFGAGPITVCRILRWEFFLLYALFVIRKTQFFSYHCGIFEAFLYLCTLEILPTATVAGLLTVLWQ